MSKEDDKTSAIGRGWASTYSATTEGFSLLLLCFRYPPFPDPHLSFSVTLSLSFSLPSSLSHTNTRPLSRLPFLYFFTTYLQPLHRGGGIQSLVIRDLLAMASQRNIENNYKDPPCY